MENEKKKICINIFFQYFPVVGTKKKKIGAKPEMGYCPFEYWLGWAQSAWRGTGAGALGAQGRGRWGGRQAQALGRGRAGRAGVRGAQAWQERRARAAGRLGRAGPGVLLGQLAVRSVHAACFWPGLTRYFSGVRFLDIVRESGS